MAHSLENFIADFEAIRDELHSIATNSQGWLDPDDLMGCCAISTHLVKDFLTQQGLEVQVVHNDEHFWCRAEGYTIDLTATQFGLDTIYIRPVAEESLHNCYRSGLLVKDFNQKYMESISWAPEQCPWRYC